MPRVKRSSRLELEVEDEKDWKIKMCIKDLILDYQQIEMLKSVMRNEIEKGLSADPEVRKESSLRMEITHVRDCINGSERGDYLALDLGGTNFRVLKVTIKSGSRFVSEAEEYTLPDYILSGTMTQLFDYIADNVQLFVIKEKVDCKPSYGNKIALGFTCSLPLDMKSIKNATIGSFTKNFNITDGEGVDVAEVLQTALDVRGLNIEVVSILNDTTGTVMCGAFLDSSCCVGLIMGTGSNVCYMEKVKNIPKHPDHATASDEDHVVINMEWGAFGDNGSLHFVKSKYDLLLDDLSLKKGYNTFEKQFSGLYLGELARVTLLRLCRDGLIFGGKPSDYLKQPGGIPSSFISQVEMDSPKDLSNTHRCLRKLQLEHVSDDDYHVVRYLANTLSVRAAQMVSACLSVVIDRIEKSEIVIAVDGSLYKNHEVLQHIMQEYVEKYCSKDKLVRFIEVSDGSGKGAGFTAAAAIRCRQENME